MSHAVSLESLLKGCADDSFEDGIRIDTELEPLGGAGAPVKPAVYEGGQYQSDRRWQAIGDAEPTPVIVIDNVPSQANRLEEALLQHRESIGIPGFVVDLSDFGLPAHLPKELSSLQFPHRNADGYLRDAVLDGRDFIETALGEAIFAATPQACGALVEWFPQSLLYGFWQSYLGKKRANTKHARAWVSEIIGWQPASTETKNMGLKGDPLNLTTGKEDIEVTLNEDDRTKWGMGKVQDVEGGKKHKLSEIGHGQVLFMKEELNKPLPAAAVSFARVTQRATISFAQLRRVSLGTDAANADAAVRALLVALGLHAHQLAFGRGFALRSGGELRPTTRTATWLDSSGDAPCDLGDTAATLALLQEAKAHARSCKVPLAPWDQAPTILTPKDNLKRAIRSTWPGESA